MTRVKNRIKKVAKITSNINKVCRREKGILVDKESRKIHNKSDHLTMRNKRMRR